MRIIFSVGMDVTEDLKVTKWDPPVPVCLRGNVRGNFPSNIKKTDEERIQNLPSYFEKYKDVEFEVTEKADGSSMTVYKYFDDSGVCSRNLNLLEEDANTFWQIAKKSGILDWVRAQERNFAVQGELIGPGIQGNNYKLRELEVRIFNVWDIDQQRYLTSNERLQLLKDTGFKHVPVLGIIKPFTEYSTMNELLDYCVGNSLITNDSKREGLVFKSAEIVDYEIVSFKGISNEYLLTCEFNINGGKRK